MSRDATRWHPLYRSRISSNVYQDEALTFVSSLSVVVIYHVCASLFRKAPYSHSLRLLFEHSVPSFRCSVGAVDGCLTPILTRYGEHQEDFTDRKAQSSLLMIPISDTRRFRYFVGGFPGSRGDSLAFRGSSWYTTAEDPFLQSCILTLDEFILGNAGFALTPFLVR
mgnify:CR=1 FL=1